MENEPSRLDEIPLYERWDLSEVGGGMKFSHINAGRWDEQLEGGMKSSVLRTRQIENNKKPNPCWRQAPITIVIVGDYGGGMKLYI